MSNIVFWLYLFNLIFLIIHEMESAYWKEWELFKLPFKLTGFLVIHIPAIFIFLIGLIFLYENMIAGYIIAGISSIAGIFAFLIHKIFIKKGHEEFTEGISQSILWLLFLFSILLLGFGSIQIVQVI